VEGLERRYCAGTGGLILIRVCDCHTVHAPSLQVPCPHTPLLSRRMRLFPETDDKSCRTRRLWDRQSDAHIPVQGPMQQSRPRHCGRRSSLYATPPYSIGKATSGARSATMSDYRSHLRPTLSFRATIDNALQPWFGVPIVMRSDNLPKRRMLLCAARPMQSARPREFEIAS
jgi:hypothetical protein